MLNSAMNDAYDPAIPKGLTEQEAAERLAMEGPNELPSSRPAGVFAIALGVVRQPIFLLLVAGGITYMLLGDVEEALMLLAFVLAVIGITIYQERKTERALDALRDLSSPRALVMRDGRQRRIAGREVVCGDALVVNEGDRVPADAILLSGMNVMTDESLLTGESVPVRKIRRPDVTEMQPPGGDDQPFLYSGTLVVKGQGIAEVKAVSVNTEIGKIGAALRSVEPEETRLQRETTALVKRLALVGAVLSALLVLAYGISKGAWIKGLLSGITLAMAILPEEFPVVLTIFLALGAWRIAQKQVLTRRIPAIEALGAATVLCVDKTGTLTFNKMTVRELYADGKTFELPDTPDGELPEEFHALVEYSILATQRDPFDPMEIAIKRVGECYLDGSEHLHEEWVLVREYPLSPELLAVSEVWRSREGLEYVIAAKGAPEAVFDLCHLSKDVQVSRSNLVRAMASKGLRVLGVARARFATSDLPGEQHDFDFELIGLLGLEDPVRPSVPQAVRECYQAGIRVVMITGDYPDTARSIARQIGLHLPDSCITGQELDAMPDDVLNERVGDANIFARVVPKQKLRLVNVLKARGDVVAMTGDGVNDAPALKAANIGIAMGQRGTDVARESAALVLLDDDFSSIVEAVRLGRRIFDNLRKATAYIFSIHVPIVGLSLLPVLLGWPPILMPVHIAFLELIIDPACSVVFEAEPEEPDVMRRPPRPSDDPLYDIRTVGLSLLQGFSVLVVIAVTFSIVCCVVDSGWAMARALAFTTLIFGNLALILSNRSRSRFSLKMTQTRNPALWWVFGAALVFLGLALYVPFPRSLFRFATPALADIAECVGLGFVLAVSFELFKRLPFFQPRINHRCDGAGPV